MLEIVSRLFKREPKIPEDYLRMVRSEYRYVPEDYIHNFWEQHKRLPSPEELQHAI